jgi:serine protease AprX
MCRIVFGVWLVITLLPGYKACATQYAFRVVFSDKNNTPYSLSSPSAYLSPRALARRTLQGISVDSTDIPVNPNYIDSVLHLTGGKFHEASRWLNLCIVLLSDSSQIHALDGKPYISNTKLVGVYGADLHRRSGNTGSSNPYLFLKTTDTGAAYYGNTWTQTNLVNGNYLHDNGFDGAGKLIAVLDAGFVGANAHSGLTSLWSSGRVVDSYDFTFANTNIFQQDGHGTEVLSTMAGDVPGVYVGAAPAASYALYLTEYEPGDQPLEMYNVLCASERADSIGADIITISLGYDLFDNPFIFEEDFPDLDGKTTIAAVAANMATKKGMLFVATAGNDGSPQIPGWGNHILTPGDADSALTIGAVDQTGTPASLSGYGPNAAGQIKPDVCGLGYNAAIFNAAGGYTSGNGTSFSTPQIAGWAACLWEANPKATPYQIRQAIIKCASSYSNPGPQLGYGVPNFQCTFQALNVKEIPPVSAAHRLIAVPNPFVEGIELFIWSDTNQDASVKIMDIAGKTAISVNIHLVIGSNKATISAPQLPAGRYVVRVNSATTQDIIKIEKL